MTSDLWHTDLGVEEFKQKTDASVSVPRVFLEKKKKKRNVSHRSTFPAASIQAAQNAVLARPHLREKHREGEFFHNRAEGRARVC